MTLKSKVRLLLALFKVGLVISGLTAFLLETELRMLRGLFEGKSGWLVSDVREWIVKVHGGLAETNSKYPFIAYGTDWLGFAHLVIAVAFIGPFRDPLKNVWVIEFGMLACCLVVPFALMAGQFRGIPLGWRLIDCSVGILGIIPLWYCRQLIARMDKAV